MSDDPIQNMRDRAVMCRRLAASTLDEQARDMLRKMASDIEIDALRLEAERENRPEQPRPVGF